MKIVNTLITLISLALIAAIPVYALELGLVLAWEFLVKEMLSFGQFHQIVWSSKLIPLLLCVCVVLYAFLVVRYYILLPMRRAATDVHHQDPDSESHW